MNLSRMEMVILGVWGCPEYVVTITRLAYVAELTVDKDARSMIEGLHDRLLTESTADEYTELYKRSVDCCKHEKIRQLSGEKNRIRRIHRAKAMADSRGWVVVDGGSAR